MSSSISSSDSASMRSLWRSGLLFVLIGLTVAGASEWLLRTHVIPNENFETHLRIVRESTTQNAIFGDSQSAFGLTGLPGFVNLANVGEPTPVIEYKIRQHFADRRPGLVILQANASMFSPHYEQDDAQKMIRGYRDAGGFRILDRRYYSQVSTYWRMFLTGDDFEANARMLSDGSRMRDRRWASLPAAVRNVEAVRGASFRVPMSEGEIPLSRTFASFQRSIEFLVEKGARVCLLNVPVSPELAAAIAEHSRYAAATKLIERVAQETGVPYIDPQPEFLDPENYDDSNHLNPKGARRLSGLVLQSCFGQSVPGRS